jgi:hypothetical protein
VPAVIEALKANNLLEAIKQYRLATNVGMERGEGRDRGNARATGKLASGRSAPVSRTTAHRPALSTTRPAACSPGRPDTSGRKNAAPPMIARSGLDVVSMRPKQGAPGSNEASLWLSRTAARRCSAAFFRS